jgi:hypothetical protein
VTTLARILLPALALVAMACGKRAFVPEEASGAPSASSTPGSVALASSPGLDASDWVVAEPPPERPGSDDEPERPPPAPLATTCDGVSLAIVSVTKDAHGIDAVVELRNASSAHVPLMLPGDGSLTGRRNPTVTFELSPNRIEPRAGCGNMNSLDPREIAFLAPHSRTKLGWLSPPTPSRSGQYTLRATYRNDPKSDQLGDNRPGPRTDALVARVRKTLPCTLVSNSVTFTWTAPPENKTRCNCEPHDPLCSCL